MNIHRLLISGAGDLGMRVARRLIQGGLWKTLKPEDVLCETMTEEKHEVLSRHSFHTRLAADEPTEAEALLIAFPPGPDYLVQVQRALSQWNKIGPALLISSTGVYTENEGNFVIEAGETKKDSLQLEAENEARRAGAHVVRLGGLYAKESGPQIHWQKIKKIEVSPSVFINLIHRHDAADAIARLMVSKLKADVWNLTDTYPMRRFDVDQLWSKHLKVSPAQFTDLDDPSLGKKIRSDKLFNALDWQPRWKSFPDFVLSLERPRNVLGGPLKCCCLMPATGFMRDGFCRTNEHDQGTHIICAEMTEAFLKFSKEAGNDLSTPRQELHFVGLRPGDKWCLCASRWMQAWEAGAAPRIHIESTHENMIEWVEPEVLRAFALDLA